MNEPIDVATAETIAFLTKYLPRSAQLIEVGCGEGHLTQPYFLQQVVRDELQRGLASEIELIGRRHADC